MRKNLHMPNNMFFILKQRRMETMETVHDLIPKYVCVP